VISLTLCSISRFHSASAQPCLASPAYCGHNHYPHYTYLPSGILDLILIAFLRETFTPDVIFFN